MTETFRQLRAILNNHLERPADDWACHAHNMAAVEYFEKLVTVAEAAQSAKDMLLNVELNHIERSIQAVTILYDPLLALGGHHEKTGRR